jgi:hypothetical protein
MPSNSAACAAVCLTRTAHFPTPPGDSGRKPTPSIWHDCAPWHENASDCAGALVIAAIWLGAGLADRSRSACVTAHDRNRGLHGRQAS